MKSTTTALAILALVCLAACNGNQDTAQLSSSESLFRRNCAVCHGKAGEGGRIGERQVPSLKAEHARSLSDEQLRRQIFDGGKGMPPFKYTLTDEHIEEVVRFIRQELQSPQPQAGP